MLISFRRPTCLKKNSSLKGNVQRGGVAIEFLFIFIIFFIVLYGTVGYFLPFLLSATYQEVATDALHSAVRDRHIDGFAHMPAAQQADYLAERRLLAETVIHNSWLPERWRQTCEGYSDYLQVDGTGIWSVCVGLRDPADKLIPTIHLFGVEVPRLPSEISGQASIRIGS